QLCEDLGLSEIALKKGHTAREPIPRLFINTLRPELSAAVDDEALHHLPQVVAPGRRIHVTAPDADDREVIGQPSCAPEIIERRYDEPFGQVTSPTEYHESCRWCLPVGGSPRHLRRDSR